MDSFPAQSAPTPGRNAAAGEFASAGAILALAGLCVVLLALSSMPHPIEAGDSRPIASAPEMPLSAWFTVANLDARLYIVVVGAGEAAQLRALLESESQLRLRLNERQRDAEVIIVASEVEANAIAEAINGEQSIPGISPAQAIAVGTAVLEGPVGSAID